MNAIILLIPFFLIRFGLLRTLDKNALQRAAFFAPLRKNEQLPYLLYQITTLMLVLFPFFLKIHTTQPFLLIGIIVYILGLILLSLSMFAFAKPQNNGINMEGIYKFSRNPMYVAYFCFFLGCVLLTQSWVLFIVLMLFQVATHTIILSEERWCLEQFGDEYQRYMKKVRRYL